MFKMLLKITAMMLSLCLFGTACSAPIKNEAPEQTAVSTDESKKGTDSAMEKTNETPRVRLTLEDGGIIEMELYPEIAPLSCELFLKGVESGYYDGKVFHRAIPGFMIQGGSKSGTGIGGMDEAIKGEFASNGFNNTLKHERGVLSLARTNDPNSASGQFFIMHEASPHLDGNYAAFGKVTSGMEYVDEIAQMPTTGYPSDELIEKPVIESIVIIKD